MYKRQPIDKSELFGWSIDAGRIKLPGEVCKRIVDGKAKALRVSSGPCQTKVVQVPTCGPWSSVTGSYQPQESKECERLCAEVATTKCDDDTAAKCFARCFPAAGVCDSIIEEYAQCGKANPFQSCSGSATRAVPNPACKLQTEAFQICRKCAQAANDACDYCTCGSCHDPIAACDADSACRTNLDCVERMPFRGGAGGVYAVRPGKRRLEIETAGHCKGCGSARRDEQRIERACPDIERKCFHTESDTHGEHCRQISAHTDTDSHWQLLYRFELGADAYMRHGRIAGNGNSRKSVILAA
mgnify:CR=1 FL=1